MKKLMAILSVLALVNVANAGYLDLQISSFDGQTITPIHEICIFPSDIIGVDVVYTPSPGMNILTISKEMQITGSMTADISQLIWPPTPHQWNPDLSRVTIISDRRQGQVGDPLLDLCFNDLPPNNVLPGVVLGHFLLHCDGFGDVVVKLVENQNTGTMESLEADKDLELYHLSEGPGIIILSIPEPATLLLLGLGAVLLRKRR